MATELPKTDRGWQAHLANIRPGGARKWLAMGGGLTICLEEGGGKTFQARIRRAGDANARRINIGAFPAVSVADARRRLAEAKALAKEGQDPAVAHRRKKAGVGDVKTLSALIDLYLTRREEDGELRGKTLAIEQTQLKVLRARLGDRLLADLELRDIATVVEAEAKRLRRAGRTGRSANIMLASAKRMFKQARGWGAYAGPNPAADLSRPAKENARERVLFDPVVHPSKDEPKLNEVGALLVAFRSAEQGTGTAVYLSLALGLRASEVAGLQWAAVQLDSDTPALDVRRSKTDAGVRTIPLPRQAVAILRGLRETSDRRKKFVFPARAHAKRAEHMHPESLSRAYARSCEALGLSDTTFHDLRRTMITGLGELTGDDVTAQRIAGHKERTALAKHYDRSRRLQAMLAPLQLWADALDKVENMAGQTGALRER